MTTSFSSFLEKFRRITSGPGYMPEIDGLRFIAICWVVVLMHLPNIINLNVYNGTLLTNTFVSAMILEGGHGVTFFFMISGFILALPFIKERRQGGQKVSLKKYYLRRLTRLEPPYIAALLLAFFLLVFVIGKATFSQLSDNLLASVFYLHNYLYGYHSTVLPVAWSLEVEVQFYLLAPLFSLVFLIRPDWVRWFLLLFVIIPGGLMHFHNHWNSASPFVDFACYFLTGMLLADLYCRKWRLVSNPVFCRWAGLLIFIGLHFIFSVRTIEFYYLKMILKAVFFYIAVTNDWWKKLLGIQWISIIGGMCYSIYLVHLMVMSAVTKVLGKFPIENKILGLVAYGIIILLAVLVVCTVFYRLVEQPCMRRDWYKYIFKKRPVTIST